MRPDPNVAKNPVLDIAAGVLVAADGRVLLARRRPGKPGAGLWEFPGGKREPGETLAAALARELDEEIGVTITAHRPLLRFLHRYSDRTVLLDIHRISGWRGRAHGREGQELAWCALEQISEYRLLAANKPVVAALRLPAEYAVTPVFDGDTERFLTAAEAVLAAGVRLLRLRSPGLDDRRYEPLAVALRERAAAHGAAVLLDRDAAMCARVGAAGLHWSAARLAAGQIRPTAAPYWFAVSCHNRGELEAAVAAGADFATLSPVAATASHPGVEPLGWSGFAAARTYYPLPVFALGGLGPADIATAWHHGAQGVAGISAFWPQSQHTAMPDAGS